MRPLLLLGLVPAAHAAPTELAHQGRLLDAAGGALNGPAALEFTIREAGGAARFSESIDVSLADGYYAVVLGRSVALDDALLGPGATIEVAVDGQALGPAQPILGVPRAALAGGLSRATVTLRGAELLGGGASADGVRVVDGRLDTGGAGYGAGTTDLVVTPANSPYVLPPGVHEFRDVTVQAGATLTALPFNGVEGGKVEIRATGTVTIAGTVDLAGRGYRGGKAVNINPTDQWVPVAMQTGQPGESWTGYGNVLVPYVANGGGGGGGEVDDCSYGAGGGGGAYGSAGASSADASVVSTGPCRYGLWIRNNNADATGSFNTNGRTRLARGGRGGGVYGDAEIGTLHLGSGGGASGSDADCHMRRGGHGGDGGGAVGLFARRIVVSGAIDVSGRSGGNAVNEGVGSCTYSGNNGGGGGGAGGSIKLVAPELVVSGALRANGGAGGAGTQAQFTGGAGGSGRIRLESTTAQVTGTIQVGSGLRSDATGADGDGARGAWVSPLLDFSGHSGRFQQVDLFAARGEGVDLAAWLCAGATAAETLLDASCGPIASSGAVDAPDGAVYGRIRLTVTDRSPERAFSLSGVRVAFGP